MSFITSKQCKDRENFFTISMNQSLYEPCTERDCLVVFRNFSQKATNSSLKRDEFVAESKKLLPVFKKKTGRSFFAVRMRLVMKTSATTRSVGRACWRAPTLSAHDDSAITRRPIGARRRHARETPNFRRRNENLRNHPVRSGVPNGAPLHYQRTTTEQ